MNNQIQKKIQWNVMKIFFFFSSTELQKILYINTMQNTVFFAHDAKNKSILQLVI